MSSINLFLKLFKIFVIYFNLTILKIYTQVTKNVENKIFVNEIQ
jgi:hypothetical protein